MTTTTLPRPRANACHPKYKAGCPDCKQRRLTYNHNRTRLITYGQWDRGHVDTAPAHEHIRLLTSRHHMSLRAIAELAGVPDIGVKMIAKGARTKAAKFTVDAICGVQPSVGGNPKRRVPGCGTARRLQAFTDAGWPPATMARLLDTSVVNVRRLRQLTGQQVSVATHQAVVDLARRIGGKPGPCWIARRYARRRRWASFSDWGVRIDDPQAQPEPLLLPDDLVDLFVVGEAAAGRVPLSRLTPAEVPHLFVLWCRREAAAGRTPGQKPFARKFDITEWQARQIAHRAALLDTDANHAGIDRPDRKAA